MTDRDEALQSLQTLGQEADSMEESKIIENYLTEVYGERCEDYDPDCRTCQAWASYDDYKSDRALTELTQSSQDMGMYDEPKLSLEELKKETSQEP